MIKVITRKDYSEIKFKEANMYYKEKDCFEIWKVKHTPVGHERIKRYATIPIEIVQRIIDDPDFEQHYSIDGGEEQ